MSSFASNGEHLIRKFCNVKLEETFWSKTDNVIYNIFTGFDAQRSDRLVSFTVPLPPLHSHDLVKLVALQKEARERRKRNFFSAFVARK